MLSQAFVSALRDTIMDKFDIFGLSMKAVNANPKIKAQYDALVNHRFEQGLRSNSLFLREDAEVVVKDLVRTKYKNMFEGGHNQLSPHDVLIVVLREQKIPEPQLKTLEM